MTRRRKPKPRIGDRVRVVADDDGKVYTVEVNQRGLPFPYYLDDGNPKNLYRTGPYSAEQLEIVND